MRNMDSYRKSEAAPSYYFPQTKAIEPSLYNFNIQSQSPIRKLNKTYKKITKDTKKQFNSFLIGRRQI